MSDENQRATSEPKRPRPRFSLLTLLLLTTIVALGVALVTVSFEVVPLRNEVEKLRAELGHLVVDTEVDDRIQAIAQNVYEDLTWKWRVYLPPGRKCSIHTKWDEIPKKAMPDAELSGGFQVTPTRLEDSTEHIIVCAVRESNDGKHWMMRLEQRQNGITSWREVTIPRKC